MLHFEKKTKILGKVLEFEKNKKIARFWEEKTKIQRKVQDFEKKKFNLEKSGRF